MHICVIASEFPPTVGGVSHYAYKLSRSLVERGNRVTVITRGSWRGMIAERIDGIRVYRVPYLHVYPLHVKIHQFFQNLVLKSLEPSLDIIHMHHPLTPPFKTTLPVITTVHSSLGFGMLESQNFYSAVRLPSLFLRIIRWYLAQVERMAIRNSDKITVVSTFVADELKSHYRRELATRSVEVIGNGVDVKLFKPGIKSKGINILYTGRLAWNKGLIDLVNAAKIVLEKRADVSFILTGEGPIGNELRKMVLNMGIEAKFSFRRYLSLSQLIDAYQSATVFVFPTYYEGLPTSVLEAMACGAPVITTPVGGIPELVHDRQNGVLVPAHDPDAIATAILNLLNDNRLRLRMGETARETIVQSYDWEKLIDKVVDLYGRTVKENNISL